MTKETYTIVLLYPDYLANQYGDTYTTYVEASDMDEAIRLAQIEADPNPEDFAPVFCCRGRCENLFPQED